MIYLDHAATSQYGNSHSVHLLGQNAKKKIENAEEIIKDCINGWKGEIYWFGSGSQANLELMRLFYDQYGQSSITSVIEHKSILQYSKAFIQLMPVDYNGIVHPNFFKNDKILPPDMLNKTKLVSIQMINNETGVIQPIKEIQEVLSQRKYQGFFHTDAVQAMGKIKIDVEDLKIDALTFSPHKFYGLQGIGGLWIRKSLESPLNPYYYGTLPQDLIYNSAIALQISQECMISNTSHLFILEQTFLTQLVKNNINFKLNINHSFRLPGFLSIMFPKYNADDLMFDLSEKNIMISTGSACNNGQVLPSYVLEHMGLSQEVINSTVRITFGKENTKQEIEQMISILRRKK